MSDLDLDAIRRDLYAAMAQVETPDGNLGFAALQALDRAHKLLDEVKRLRAESAQTVATLRSAAAGRREYAAATPEHPLAQELEAEASVLDLAARVAEGDMAPMYGWLPSWRWTDAMRAEADRG